MPLPVGLAAYERMVREGGDAKHQQMLDDLLTPPEQAGLDMSRIDPATGEPPGWDEGITVA